MNVRHAAAVMFDETATRRTGSLGTTVAVLGTGPSALALRASLRCGDSGPLERGEGK